MSASQPASKRPPVTPLTTARDKAAKSSAEAGASADGSGAGVSAGAVSWSTLGHAVADEAASALPQRDTLEQVCAPRRAIAQPPRERTTPRERHITPLSGGGASGRL